jgi:hypothetical protein
MGMSGVDIDAEAAHVHAVPAGEEWPAFESSSPLAEHGVAIVCLEEGAAITGTKTRLRQLVHDLHGQVESLPDDTLDTTTARTNHWVVEVASDTGLHLSAVGGHLSA